MQEFGSFKRSCWQGQTVPIKLPLWALFILDASFHDCFPFALLCRMLYVEMILGASRGLTPVDILSLGIVNDQFSQIHTLKSEEEPEHVVQLIDKYFVEVETILSELTSKIDCPDVDFSKLSELAHKVDERSLRLLLLKGNSDLFGAGGFDQSIGARHVKLACADLIKSCDQMNKENFSRALIWIKNEFSHTRNKLEAYAQMERRIIRLKSKQQSSACVPSSSLGCLREVPEK
nr:histidine-containing phosphotransfer protein 1 [Quercus suber]